MNWKKALKYFGIGFLVLNIIGGIYMHRVGTRMYGGLTQKVDHKQFQAKTGSFIIKNAKVLSSDGNEFISGKDVWIENGKIKSIDTSLQITSNIEVIDGADRFLIPGLIDAHVHLFQSPNDLLLYIANGVTEARELIGSDEHLRWREEIENGRIGPKLFVASPRLGSFGKLVGWFMSYSQGFLNISTAADAEKKVQELYDKGYDGLKIYSHLNKESYLAICKKANELNMPVFGHIPWSIDFEDVWENGQGDVAHFEEIMNALRREFYAYDEAELKSLIGNIQDENEALLAYINHRSDDIASSLNQHNITVTSTLWLTQSFVRQKFELDQILSEVALAYENPGISEGTPIIPKAIGWLPKTNRYLDDANLTDEEKAGSKAFWDTYGNACQLLAKNLSERGVTILAGTDANLPPTVPGFSLHDELIALNKAGMSPTEVLKSATINPANWLKSNSGQISQGFDANLILLDKNPLENIENTKAINTVIAKGHVYDRSLLNEILAAVKKANDQSRKVSIE